MEYTEYMLRIYNVCIMYILYNGICRIYAEDIQCMYNVYIVNGIYRIYAEDIQCMDIFYNGIYRIYAEDIQCMYILCNGIYRI